MWTNLDLDPDFPDHPKVLGLEDRVGPEAIAYIIRLWCWSARFAATGHLTNKRCSPERLEVSVMRWPGEPGKLIAAMVAEGFLHKKRNGIEIHGFADRQAHISMARERGRKAARARWDKEKGRTAPEPEPAKRPPAATENLSWQQFIPWIKENLFRYEEVDDQDGFASKMLVRAIDKIGVTWPDLQERLLDASAYLKANTRKYKNPRGFYWNQIKETKPSVTKENDHRRTPANAPAGWVREENGVFFDAAGKPMSQP